MGIAIRAFAGPLINQVFPIEAPITLGRVGQIKLPDPKVSGIHAQIEKSSSGQWKVVDNGSKNGIRVDDVKVASIKLVPGIKFYIGDSGFEVIEVASNPAKVEPPAPSADAAPAKAARTSSREAKAGQAEAPKKKAKKKYWHQALADFVKRHVDTFKDRPRPVVALQPAIVLEFVRGVQTNSKWVLGYGPRKLGAASLDLPIWEPSVPDICFELQPSSDGIVFKTEHPKLVRLNQKSVDSEVLRVGDIITINETMIEVDFIE
ncbi:MAG: FHA domain-containing protein [Bdellovibrionales bacterium]